ncbi:MAG: hypothetical protein AAB481_03915 [Patescibacteria group bacterium]
MKLSADVRIAFIATAVSFAAGAAIANYDGISRSIFGPSDQPNSGEQSGIPSCPPNSVDVESLSESAQGSNLGLAPSGVICTLGR